LIITDTFAFVNNFLKFLCFEGGNSNLHRFTPPTPVLFTKGDPTHDPA